MTGQDPPLTAPAPADLTGVVVDAASGAGLGGATLELEPGGRRAVADSVGGFTFADILPGSYTLVIRRLGFVELSVTLAFSGTTGPLRLELIPDPLVIEGLTVTGATRGLLQGVVLDASTGEPLPLASIRLVEGVVRQAGEQFSDGAGAFRFEDLSPGLYLLQPRMLGYTTFYLPLTFVPPLEPLELRMAPDSLVRAGLPHLEERLRGRRNAYLGIAVSYGAEDLNRYDRKTAHHFVLYDTWVGPMGDPTVYIDGFQVCGAWAINELLRYRPGHFHAIEVFGRGTVHAYTREYMEQQAIRQARNPGVVLPPLIHCFLLSTNPRLTLTSRVEFE